MQTINKQTHISPLAGGARTGKGKGGVLLNIMILDLVLVAEPMHVDVSRWIGNIN